MMHKEFGSLGAATTKNFDRHRAFNYLRVLVTVITFFTIAAKVHLGWIGQIGKRGFGLLSVAFIATVIGIALSALRWNGALDALKVKKKFSELFKLQLVGLFASNFLPSTVGGDIVRARWLGRCSDQVAEGFASVIIERLTGWLVLPCLALIGIAFDPAMLHLGKVSGIIITIATATLTALMILITFTILKKQVKPNGRFKSLSAIVASLEDGINQFKADPASLAKLIAWAIAYQLSIVTAALFAASAIHIAITWRELLVMVPTVAMLQVLPLTIGGIGVREGALVLMLQPLGIATTQAIEFGLVVYGINVLASLLGAPSFALGGPQGEPVTVTEDVIGSDKTNSGES
ncbi:MAG: lysylphosphatidylglycerol synthase transmembrane domain-containing protein [Actinomycetota bacterium]|nr:lysylphosphatidylglycerol synthase transmembrane domain-containing protein [Actinomycetota bacterium]